MPTGGDDPYTVLGVDRSADQAEILDAYRRLVGQSNRMAAAGGSRGGRWLTRVEHAYAVLSDPLRRADHDATRGPEVRVCRLCGLPLSGEERHHEACVEPERSGEDRTERRRRFWNEVARWVGWGSSA